MDAAVQLALMAKARKVFGTEDSFLSFPVAPLPYTRADLEFFADQDGEAARTSDANLAGFSALVNLIPSDEAWLPTETRFLWEVYADVLRNANFALSTRSEQEEAAYQAACAFLGKLLDTGEWEDSPPVKAYKTYEDAVRVATEQYQAAKYTAENASDPEVKNRWTDTDEPAARARLDALQAQWVAEGQKNEVEEARARRVSLGARSPVVTRAQWQSRFNQDIDTLSESSGNVTVFPSAFTPRNALDEGAWKQFQLTTDELPALLDGIPATLKDRFGAGKLSDPSVKSISFEFSSALIQREWFASDAFKSHFWRFPESTPPLSDGGKPPKGSCPAYVTGVVFGRRVVIETEGEPAKPPEFDGFRFPTAVTDQPRLADIPQARLNQPLQLSDRLGRLLTEKPPVLNLAGRAPRADPQVAAMAMRPADVSRAPMVRMGPSPGAAMASLKIDPNMKPGMMIDPAATRLRRHLAVNLPLRIDTITLPPPAPAPVRKQTKVTPDDQLFILAFVCKTVPKCPDPDPGLQW